MGARMVWSGGGNGSKAMASIWQPLIVTSKPTRHRTLTLNELPAGGFPSRMNFFWATSAWEAVNSEMQPEERTASSGGEGAITSSSATAAAVCTDGHRRCLD